MTVRTAINGFGRTIVRLSTMESATERAVVAKVVAIEASFSRSRSAAIKRSGSKEKESKLSALQEHPGAVHCYGWNCQTGARPHRLRLLWRL